MTFGSGALRIVLLALGLLAGGLVLAGGQPAHAGGGAENVLLLVNELSDDSKTIANHYIRWRNLPDSNVVCVEWDGPLATCTPNDFREKLLRPALEAIKQRGLGLQIDYLVYSAGFPYRVDFQSDYPEEKLPRQMRPMASLTGATYLWQYALQKSPALVLPDVNWYVPPPPGTSRGVNAARCQGVAGTPSRGFRSRYAWTKEGTRSEDPQAGQRYLLSTMLGYTSGRGNTVDEVLNYLQRSIEADGRRPGGTFYFAQNQNVRSATRHACYRGVVDALRREGASAEIVAGEAPRGKADIVGLTVGAEECDLAASGSAVMAGAICEHLTSYGGDLRKGGYQMPLTNFLRQGAAGASGTVVEPLAIQAKFPLPTIHLHYRRGCSLAEAFYQSITGPYQILIVGDPLCQPWAQPPRMEIDGLVEDKPVRGELELATRLISGAAKGGLMELYLDGRLMARPPFGRAMKLDTKTLTEGHHELRFVVRSDDEIEAPASVVSRFVVDNDPEVSLRLEASPLPVAGIDDWIDLTATATLGNVGEEASDSGAEKNPVTEAAPRAKEVVFEHAGRELGRASLEGEGPYTARLRVRGRRLGAGPVRLRARLDTGEQAAPIWMVVR